MKIAIVYDRVNKWGGAERVLLFLHEIFPKAELFTSVYHPKASWAKVFPKIQTSFLNKFSFLRDKHELIPFLMPMAFESFDFSNYDIVISVTSEAAKGVRVSGKTKLICYCLTPTRYLWHAKDLLIGKSLLIKPIISYLKKWDRLAASRPDVFIAISKTVQRRIKKYYKRDSKIIYPPVDLSFFKSNLKRQDRKSFLIVSRLVKHKMVKFVVKAFNDLPYSLRIVGTGREEVSLRKIAGKNIKFLGQLTDYKLKEEYRKAKALIFPQEEDFGLVSLEAQAMGVPVIAYKKGGALETIIQGKTGIFFNSQTTSSLKKAILKINKITFDQKILRKNAEKFSKEKFKKDFVKMVTELL